MTNTPAGWYTDPEQPNQYRWWDGYAWTDHRSAPAAPYTPATSQAPAAALKAPEGTNWNTVWIWILVFLPYVSSLGVFAIRWPTSIDPNHPMQATVDMLTSPGYLFTLIAGPITLGIFAWLAYLDWRTLQSRGVPRPFHWAWGFLSVVYTIGRSVVVRRRTGRGISPMWVTIVGYVIYTVAIFAYLIMMMTNLFSSIFDSIPRS